MEHLKYISFIQPCLTEYFFMSIYNENKKCTTGTYTKKIAKIWAMNLCRKCFLVEV